MKNYKYLTNINMMATGNRIKSAIENSEYSNEDIADFIGVTVRTIQYWRAGKRNPSLENIHHLSLLLDVPITDFISTNMDLITTKNYKDEISEYINDNNNNIEDYLMHPFFPYLLKKSYPVTTLEEFLLYYPLFDSKQLQYFFQMIDGSVPRNMDYVYKQIDFMYEHILDKEERNRIDEYIDLFLKYPRVYEILEGSTNKIEDEKWQKYMEYENKRH